LGGDAKARQNGPFDNHSSYSKSTLVVPELPLGTITALGATFAPLILLRKIRNRK
jgi:hypothetical protein